MPGVAPIQDFLGELVGRRYRLVGLLGHGGMGSVYRAEDLLDGEVALKRLRTSVEEIEGAATQQSIGATRSRGDELAVSLAHEFRTLASLRHPNIISVLDYGFDAERRPYLTMDLLVDARPIVEAGRALPIEGRIELLAQMLRALQYLHRRGIIHRDLKPGNVLVVGQQVKVLDFGIAVARDQIRRATAAGTPGYIAPEVLRGEGASERSDLFAVGVIAHEMLLGSHPFDSGAATTAPTIALVASGPTQAARGEVPTTAEVSAPLAAIIERLLAPEPGARFATANEVTTALRGATGIALPEETAATRESFLQSAVFVGREAEHARLAQALTATLGGHGEAILIGGESGVGKSRLTEEVRALALVRGAVVLRGQQVRDGSNPYHPFRAPLRSMAALTEVSDYEAAVLSALVPDIGVLLDRPISPLTEIDSDMAQARLLAVIEDLFTRQRQPMVLMLEDLQWAGSESTKLLQRLTGLLHRTPVLVIGTYRDDERADLPSQVPQMQLMRLGRLGGDEVAQLTESMLGRGGRESGVLDMLRRETEGNPFFLVEVVRALAEEVGGLDRISAATLRRVFPRGMGEVVERRLDRIPGPSRSLLTLAAIIGRELDTTLLAALSPSEDIERWLALCADASVLEFAESRWRFAHDKLRERQLARIDAQARPGLHRRVGEAIERAYPGAPDQTAALAHHFGRAGDRVKESHYAGLAGEIALGAGAYKEALRFVERARGLLEEQVAALDRGVSIGGLSARLRDAGARLGFDSAGGRGEVHSRLGHLETIAAEACFQLGDMATCQTRAEIALSRFGRPMPRSSAAWALGTMRQVAERALQTLRPSLFEEHDPATRELRNEAGRLQARLTDVFMYSGQPLPTLWSGLRMLNLCEPAGSSAELARGYTVMAVVAGTIPLHAVASAWARRALELATHSGTAGDIAYVLCRNGVYSTYLGRWSEVEEWITRSLALLENVNDFRLLEEARALRALVSYYQGRFAEALPEWSWIEQSAHRRGAAQWDLLGQISRALALVRLGRADEAVPIIEASLAGSPQAQAPENVVNVFGCLGLAHLRRGDPTAARAAIERAVAAIAGVRPSAHWNQMGTAMATETSLLLWEAAIREGAPEVNALRTLAQTACKAMRAFAATFPFAGPFAALTDGLFARLDGRPALAGARWERGLSQAKQLAMPFEEARVRFEIARSRPHGDPDRQHHLARAEALFHRLGAADDLARARVEFG